MTHKRPFKVREIQVLRSFRFLTQSVEDVGFKETIKIKKLTYFQEKINFLKSYFFGIHKDYDITLGKVILK